MTPRPNLPRTSIEAWGIKRNGISTDHRIIWMALDELGDATYTEIRNWALSNLYRIRHKHSLLEPAAVGRRLSEMERAGMIEKTGKQRVTPSRRKANVYRIKKQIVN